MKTASRSPGHVVVYKETEDQYSRIDEPYGLGTGGLVGAVSRVKERKRQSIASEEKEKHRSKHRPGRKADGTSDGTVGMADIAQRLTYYNSGVRPNDIEILKILKECPTNQLGRVREADWDTLLELWLSRTGAAEGKDKVSRGLPAVPFQVDHGQIGGKCCCTS
ncbi:hypothetical protein CEUSTIGMA_g2308.t1 [Chlamydomonas eustigma]|uniref:Uncharacterized protein n=1 Tax=Chlamydomonas eustigma TaxID=1157962 RepID=A0A250WW62_9CHLO|nr:hypothetical protein CEUSTIGMA_g2308.t1 [Chlamydomonas eustigma]|eukprot:GAX74862.1 hypothetical protein CEUSTIGMA_g2308.t1 [Chlamydomonas eustigma]